MGSQQKRIALKQRWSVMLLNEINRYKGSKVLAAQCIISEYNNCISFTIYTLTKYNSDLHLFSILHVQRVMSDDSMHKVEICIFL